LLTGDLLESMIERFSVNVPNSILNGFSIDLDNHSPGLPTKKSALSKMVNSK